MPRRITVEQRMALLKVLTAKRGRGDVEVAAEDDPEAPAPAPARLTTKQYIRARMDEIKPLIEECYRDAKALDPALGTTVPVGFTIEGEPGVGGLVTEASLHSSMANHAALDECVRETLYTLEIDPPERGGDVSVVYPFDFQDEDK